MTIDPVAREIVALHGFFQDWLGGTLPNDDETFERVERALAPGFTFVTTSGVLLPREGLLTGLRTAHGSRVGLRIDIDVPSVRHTRGALDVATYVERQREGAEDTRRLSTALFDATGDRERPMWLHVHETWMSPK